MITEDRQLAIFGGQPLFETPKPVGQLASPDAPAFIGLLRDHLERPSDDRYAESLESRLRALHGVKHCIAVANAGLALVILMRLFAESRRGEVVMPAFSYRGLPHFAQWAGQMPAFAEVELETHGLDPRDLARFTNERTTSILSVNNFNAPSSIDELQAAADEVGLPLFFDSVYGLGATYHGRPLGGNGRAEVFSMHATKLLNGFEGGYVTTNFDNVAQAVRDARDHGLNARLNEVHAAMALLSLDDLDDVIRRNRERFSAYREVLSDIVGLTLVPYHEDESERHNYEMAVVEVNDSWPLTRDEMVKILRAENVLITSYYSPPLHRGPHAPRGIVAPDLPVCEVLARRYFQLPVGELTSIEDIYRLGDFLAKLQRSASDVVRRLRDV